MAELTASEYPLAIGAGAAVASWSTSLTRSFLVDDALGNDANLGYIDAAPGTDLSAVASGVAVKTLARLAAILPRFGNGRSAEVIIKSATYSGGLFGGQYGYSSFVVRGTSTDTTAGSTAFKCDATDYLHLGGVRAAGTNAAGYNIAYSTKTIQLITPGTPISVQCNTHGFSTGDKIYIPDATALPEARGYFTITVVDANNFTLDSTTSTNGAIGSTWGAAYRWKVTLAGGGSPSFTNDDTSTGLSYFRLRGDATTTTAGLRNFVSTIIANGVDTIVPADDLTTAVGTDVFYIEEPGVVVSVVNLVGGQRGTGPSSSATLIDQTLAGIKTGTLTVSDTGLVAAFIHATSSVSILRCGNVQLGSVYTDNANTTRTTGGCRLAAGNNLNSIDKLTLDRVGFLGATLFFNIKDSGSGNSSSPACLFAGGLNVRGCTPDATGQQTGLIIGSFPNSPTLKMTRFKGTNGTIQAIIVAQSGVAFFECQISDCTDGLQIAGEGSVVDIIGLCGSRAISNFGIVFGGPVWSYRNSLLLRNINRFSGVFGTNGAIRMGSTIDPLTNNPAGPSFLDFANFLVANVVDGNGNRVMPVSSNGLNFNGAHLLSCQNWPAASALSAYNVVRVDSSSKAALAEADTVAHAGGVLGFTVGPAGSSGVTSSVLVSQDDGWVTCDVSSGRPAPTIGQKIWLSTSTAGLAQANEPTGSQPKVFLGYCVQTGTSFKARVVRHAPPVPSTAFSVLETLSIASGVAAVCEVVNLPQQTVTITGNTAIATASGFNYAEIYGPVYTSASAVTITNAATLHVMGPPTQAGSTTITNSYAVGVDGTWTNIAGSGRGIRTNMTFAPTSGTGTFRALSLSYTLNQTGGANGNVDGIFLNATETAFGGSTHNLLVLQVGGQNKLQVISRGTEGPSTFLGPNVSGGSTATLLGLDASRTVQSGVAATWDGVDFQAATATITGSTGIATAAGFNAFAFRAPVLSAASAVTVTNSATVMISGAPTAAGAGPAAITNAYSLWVQAGTARFDGVIRGGGTGGARIYSQTNSTTDHGYLVLDDASGSVFGYTVHTSVAMDGGTMTIKSDLANTGKVQTTADIITFLNAAATEAARFTINLNLLLGTTTDVASTKLRINASKTIASLNNAVWDGVDVIASTATISGSTPITNTTGFNLAVLRQPTLSAASALTVTNAATLVIAGAPVGGGAGPATITNAFALWVQAGAVRFDGTLGVGGTPAVGATTDFQGSSTSALAYLFRNNNNSDVNAHARLQLQVGGGSGGDPFTLYTLSGGQDWAVGLDNSDSDKFKISRSASLGTSDQLVLGNSAIDLLPGGTGTVTLGDAVNFVVSTTAGTKIGTATTQKIGFWNATPVVQPSTTGTSTGFTAGAGTAVQDVSTFTGGTGSTAYRISDIVLALKQVGILAS